MKKIVSIATIKNGRSMHPEQNAKDIKTLFKGLENKKIRITYEPFTPTYTESQRGALHLWFKQMGDALNEAGYTVQMVLKEKMDLEWDGDKFKNLLWRPTQQAILKKDSTTELKKTGDLDKCIEHLHRHMGEKFGVHVPFPNDDKKDEAPLIDNQEQHD